MTDSNQNNSGTVELRNTVLLSPNQPPVDGALRVEGELWVDADSLQMYVFSFDIDGESTPGWIGVTSGQNHGSIIYSGPTPPTLANVYPNLLDGDVDISLDPLPGTVWYDTTQNMLKIYWVVPGAAPVDDGDPTTPTPTDAYNASWVSVTTSHYLTEATASLVTSLQLKVTELEQTVTDLDAIINPGS